LNFIDIFQIVPILRAGLALADLATSILPSTRTFHLGEKKITFDLLEKKLNFSLADVCDAICFHLLTYNEHHI